MTSIDPKSPRNVMIKPEVQTHWGWWVVLYIFLAGLGAGTFLFSFIMLFMDKLTDPARIGVFIGPILVSIGAFMLLLDLGSPLRAFRLFTTRSTWKTSWLVRGSYILTIFVILSLAYGLLPWLQASALGKGLGLVAAIFALLVLVEPGLLLAVNNSIPLWNTSALPALFFFSALNAGIALFVLISLAFPTTIGVAEFQLMAYINIVILIVTLVVLASFLEIVKETGSTAALSVRLLLSPSFVRWGIQGGMLAPLAIFILCAIVPDVVDIRFFYVVASLLILSGGLILRAGMVNSGLRLPVIS